MDHYAARLRPACACAAAAIAVTLTTGVGISGISEEQNPQSVAAGSAEPLFVEVQRRAGPPPLSALAPHTIRRRTVQLLRATVASGVILETEAHLLNLFPDVSIVAVRSHVESHDARRYSWFGTIPGDPLGRVVVTVIGDTMAATIDSQGRRYVVLPSGSDLHEVLELDLASFPDEEPTVELRGSRSGRIDTKGERRGGQAAKAIPLDTRKVFRVVPLEAAETGVDYHRLIRRDNGSVLDVMFLYTHKAAHSADPGEVPAVHSSPHSATGLMLQIQQSIDAANLSYDDSGVPTRLQWVGWPMEVSNAEDQSFFADLQDLVDGEVDGVFERRDLLAADIVVLLRAGGDGCGRSAHIRRLADDDSLGNEVEAAALGFVVVRLSCLQHHSLAHEIGHQLGAVHDGSEEDGVAPYAQGYAHPDPMTGFRTIMALHTSCGSDSLCKRIGRWSDPNAPHPEYGIPLGLPENPFTTTFDRAAITENLWPVSNYRFSICRTTTAC
jgi:hypothetical protein